MSNDGEIRERALELLSDYQLFVARFTAFAKQPVPVEGRLAEALDYFIETPHQIGNMYELRNYMPEVKTNDGETAGRMIPDELPLLPALLALEAYAGHKGGKAMIFCANTETPPAMANAVSAIYRAAIDPTATRQMERHVTAARRTSEDYAGSHPSYDPDDVRGEAMLYSELFTRNRGIDNEFALCDPMMYPVASLNYLACHGEDMKLPGGSQAMDQARALMLEFNELNQRFSEPAMKEFLVSHHRDAAKLAEQAFSAVSSERRTER